MKKDEQEECIRLLKEAYTFICFIPNRAYQGGEYPTSYKLANGMEQLFNKLNRNDTKNK